MNSYILPALPCRGRGEGLPLAGAGVRRTNQLSWICRPNGTVGTAPQVRPRGKLLADGDKVRPYRMCARILFKTCNTPFRLGGDSHGELSCYKIEHPMANDRKDCKDFSKQNLFTISRHSGAKNARLGALFGSRQMENGGRKAKFLHIHHGFVHVFSPYLVPFRGFVSTPKNKTATPNFFSALTF